MEYTEKVRFLLRIRLSLWQFIKNHRVTLYVRRMMPLFTPDWFSQPYSSQSKNTQFKGVLWGQFAPANGRTEQAGRGGTSHSLNSNLRPSQAGIQFIYYYQFQRWLRFLRTPWQSKTLTHNSIKKEDAAQRLHPLINYLDLYLSISSRILKSCSCSSGVLAERNS